MKNFSYVLHFLSQDNYKIQSLAKCAWVPSALRQCTSVKINYFGISKCHNLEWKCTHTYRLIVLCDKITAVRFVVCNDRVTVKSIILESNFSGWWKSEENHC